MLDVVTIKRGSTQINRRGVYLEYVLPQSTQRKHNTTKQRTGRPRHEHFLFY